MSINHEAFDKVLEACRQHRHEYLNQDDGAIRFRVDRINHCPLTLAARQFHGLGIGVSQYYVAAKALGLSNQEATQIVCAADGIELDHGETLLIRYALLAEVETPNRLPAVVKEHAHAD